VTTAEGGIDKSEKGEMVSSKERIVAKKICLRSKDEHKHKTNRKGKQLETNAVERKRKPIPKKKEKQVAGRSWGEACYGPKSKAGYKGLGSPQRTESGQELSTSENFITVRRNQRRGGEERNGNSHGSVKR